MTFTPGARLLILPGAAALWPYVLRPMAQGARPAMTRSHRFAHRLIWPALAIAIALGLTMALALRPPPDPPAATGEQTMSVGFRAVQWNRDKLIYDAVLAAGVVAVPRRVSPPSPGGCIRRRTSPTRSTSGSAPPEAARS